MVANRPQGLRDMNEKVFTAVVPAVVRAHAHHARQRDIKAFATEHGKIVLKPLDGMGGKSIFVTEKGDKNPRSIIETLTDNGERFAIAQRYVPEIAAPGDSRVLLIDGEPSPTPRPHPGRRRQSRQPRSWRKGVGPSSPSATAGSRGNRPALAEKGWCSSALVVSADTSPRSTSPSSDRNP